ncbi:unnamed protein product [Echinostoma caproni]|uniref:Fungal_trans domain-containing protein n=1 Tax=Echinostoma caproni TaxID=27848 RepID=A0A183B885_9TREM|nr:unnamed protein product [Echinostoma caproni]
MVSYTRDLHILIARTTAFIDERCQNVFGQIDLDKYYPGLNGNASLIHGDHKRSDESVRLPKLRSDHTLVSTDHVNLVPPNEEEISLLRLLSLLEHHVEPSSKLLEDFLSDASKWMQHLIDWFAAPNRFVALAQFILCPTTRNRLIEQLTSFNRVMILQLAQAVVITPHWTFKSAVEWDKQSTTGTKPSFNLHNSLPYTLLNYLDTIASIDQSGLCKLLAAPIVKLIARKRIHMYEQCTFPDMDPGRSANTSSLLFVFLTVRAYGLTQLCHRVVDFIKNSPELIDGSLKDLILTRSPDVFTLRTWSATSRAFYAIRIEKVGKQSYAAQLTVVLMWNAAPHID